MSDFVIAGAGTSGLTLAAELAAAHRVTLVERAPALGGVLGPKDERIADMADRCRRRGVEIHLGLTGVRWDVSGLHVVGEHSSRLIAARHLIVATGLRPSTASELGIVGTRPAGVAATPSALRLLQDGVLLGRRVVVIGTGWSARAVEHAAVALGARVIRLPKGSRPTEIIGRPRVAALIVDHDDGRREIACDAIVLADDLHPRRNIDGAVATGSQAVTHLPVNAPDDAVEAVLRRAHAVTQQLDSRRQPV